jgi:hypothetical protein
MALLLTAFVATPAIPQETAEAVIRGRVMLGDGPLPGATVVIHRVAPDGSGELDSIAAGTDGTFRVRLPHVPDPENRSEMFFASVRHQGILYFGVPVTTAAELDSVYLIQAYDTLTAPVGGADLPVRVRNVFLEGDASGWRVTDLLQVSNPDPHTLVPRAGDVVWRYPLPSEATDFELGQGDFGPEQAVFDASGVRIESSVPPGERILVIRYRLPSPATSFPMPGFTERAELLIKEPAPRLAVTGLDPVAAVELEPGNTYRRYLGAGLQDSSVDVEEVEEGRALRIQWLTVALALLLTLAGILAVQRRGRVPPAVDTAQDERSRILLEIARLDESHEAQRPDALSAEEYTRRRRELVSRLRDSSGS